MAPMIASILPAVQTQQDHPDDSIFRALGMAISDRLMRLEIQAIRDEYRPTFGSPYEPNEEDERAYLEELSGGSVERSAADGPSEIDGYGPGYCS